MPDFGVDEDIAATVAHEKAASREIGHTWEPEFDIKKDEWVVPKETADFELIQMRNLVVPDSPLEERFLQLYSDPNCTSVKCKVRHSFPSKENPEEVHYADDTTPLDGDIVISQGN